MMAVKYHGCTCHQRYIQHQNLSNGREILRGNDMEADLNSEDFRLIANGNPKEEMKPQPWYFHVVASLILVVHGITFLVPQETEDEDTDMVRTIAKWFGYELDWVRHFTPYAQVSPPHLLADLGSLVIAFFFFLNKGLASVFNISLGIVCWWTSKESERYNRLIQLRVFAFCINILHAYITGPIIYQSSEDMPIMTPGKTGRIIGLFRLSYLTPGLMCAGVTEVIVEKEQEANNSNNKIPEIEQKTQNSIDVKKKK